MNRLRVLVRNNDRAGGLEFGLSLPLIDKELFTVNMATSLETKLEEVPSRGPALLFSPRGHGYKERCHILWPTQSCADILGLLHASNKVEMI